MFVFSRSRRMQAAVEARSLAKNHIRKQLSMEKDDKYFMRRALEQARKAAEMGEVPVGCVVVHDGHIAGCGHNLRESRADPTAHAEIEALKQAAKEIGTWHLEGTTVYCTLEPCCMCAGAMVNARVKRLAFGLSDDKSGACGSVVNLLQQPALNHQVEVTSGVLAEESLRLLQAFFRERR